MMTKNNEWLKERGRAVHMTIRDIDCADFNVEAFIKGLYEMGVSFFSFFAGGYITTYPTNLDCQRVSPYLNGRDLTGDLITTAHQYGIKALAMIDLGQLPKEAGDKHKDWCAKDAKGKAQVIEDRLYATCPNSGFRKEYAIEIVQEILSLYDVDCIKFGGGSYGFSNEICYCERCKNEYKVATGQDIPAKRDWNNPNWRIFFDWQRGKTAETVEFLVKMVKSIDPGMPVMGNSVCFGDPVWTMKAALDMEELAKHQDAVQVEVQSRINITEHATVWQSLTWPAETANYMTNVTDKPVWVVASYFLAWPWRRSAMPYAEQKVYYAQMIANGATPMVNLSGGPMAVHEDKRGFKAISEIYNFMKDNLEYYEGDKSLARIAVVFSQKTLIYYGQDEAMNRYVQCIRGVEQSLNEMHIPFDLISLNNLKLDLHDKYDVMILPNLACMSDEEADIIRDYVEKGGNLVVTGETSLYDEYGYHRDDFLLRDVLGVAYLGSEEVDELEDGRQSQAYMEIKDSDEKSVFLDNIDDTTVIPIMGKYIQVEPLSTDTETILTLGTAFPVFPEGFSYPLNERKQWPMMLLSTYKGQGKVVFFPNHVDKCFMQTFFPDLKHLISNAVTCLSTENVPVKIQGSKTLLVSSRVQKNRHMIHLINLNGGWRFFESLITLTDIEVGVDLDNDEPIKKAYLLSTQKEIIVENKDGYAWVKVPKLKDYDVVVFEK